MCFATTQQRKASLEFQGSLDDFSLLAKQERILQRSVHAYF